jgi:hypothetical protein
MVVASERGWSISTSVTIAFCVAAGWAIAGQAVARFSGIAINIPANRT